MCHDGRKEKTKTKELLNRLREDTYIRAPCMDILSRNRYRARVQIMSMYRMLDCAKNYKCGYRGTDCSMCKTCDDEDHRINHCIRYRRTNLYESSLKFDFSSIYSDNAETVERAIDIVCHLWELNDGKNSMRDQ